MNKILEKLLSSFENKIEVASQTKNHASLILHQVEILPELIADLKNTHKFKMLIDICGVDYPSKEKRFEVVYQFLNLDENLRLTVKVPVAENEEIPSLNQIFGSACWFERETHDMYGIVFSGAKDLRRILTDYDFEGFPLRKDFPLTGFTEIKYDPTEGKIIKQPVNLSQEYRAFDFESPWENVQYEIKKNT